MSPIVAGIIIFVIFIVVFVLFGINPTVIRHQSLFSWKRHIRNGAGKSAKCDTLVRAKCVRFVTEVGSTTEFEHELRMAVYEVNYAGKTYEVCDRILLKHKNSEIGTTRDVYINPNNENEIYIDYGPEEHNKAQTAVFYFLLAFVAVGLVAAVIGIMNLF